jgi:hypothetical protein
MAVLADLTEEEKYLLAIIVDQSGVDQAEFMWTDETSKDFVFRCWDFQYSWYRNRSKFQIDQCVAEGSSIITGRGNVPIEEVVTGDTVLTHKGNWGTVTATWDRGIQDTVIVSGEGFKVRVTPDHRIYSLRRAMKPEWTEARNLIAGRGNKSDSVSMWVDPGEQIWVDVKKVKSDRPARCYDLEVIGDNSFVADGIAVHNCGRAIGKSNGIQMRAFAFPFTNPGEEMLLTAPELIHLDPVTRAVEQRVLSVRFSREFLQKSGTGNGIRHRPFEARFRNGSRIVGRIPQKDGRGVKGSVSVDSSILTSRGLRSASNIKIGDMLYTHNDRFRPVSEIHRYKSNITHVRTADSHGVITVSGNHRFYTLRQEDYYPTWAIVDSIIGEKIATPTHFPAISENLDQQIEMAIDEVYREGVFPGWLFGASEMVRYAILNDFRLDDEILPVTERNTAVGLKLLLQSLGMRATIAKDGAFYEIQVGDKLENRLGDNIFWSQVTEVIESDDLEEVVDFVVEDDFSYISDGVVSKGSS